MIASLPAPARIVSTSLLPNPGPVPTSDTAGVLRTVFSSVNCGPPCCSTSIWPVTWPATVASPAVDRLKVSASATWLPNGVAWPPNRVMRSMAPSLPTLGISSVVVVGTWYDLVSCAVKASASAASAVTTTAAPLPLALKSVLRLISARSPAAMLSRLALAVAW